MPKNKNSELENFNLGLFLYGFVAENIGTRI